MTIGTTATPTPLPLDVNAICTFPKIAGAANFSFTFITYAAASTTTGTKPIGASLLTSPIIGIRSVPTFHGKCVGQQ